MAVRENYGVICTADPNRELTDSGLPKTKTASCEVQVVVQTQHGAAATFL